MDNKRFWIVLGIIVVGLIGAFMFTGKDDTADIGNSTGSNNIYGKTDSKVTLTEFVDFQCEACYAYFPVVQEVKEMYKDKIKFQVKHFPITSSHQFAMQAAKSAEAAAKQGKFWEMHDQIFGGQKTWEKTQNPQKIFDSYAQSLGIDMAKFATDRASAEVNSIVNADLREVGRLGGKGTPTFVLNGKLIESPDTTVDSFSKVLDEALKNQGAR